MASIGFWIGIVIGCVISIGLLINYSVIEENEVVAFCQQIGFEEYDYITEIGNACTINQNGTVKATAIKKEYEENFFVFLTNVFTQNSNIKKIRTIKVVE